ncbi:MAG: peptidoglycan DD-metalloendopeptidase family protein [Chloroflexi bacterium]|nr:peptidoglycan DD-metalloendopeptidase family protein [Anaerolineaceae bacterium]NLI44945.1 peptidoglycan DD-metalloendopeptidase family protein [Chloroflexota bacterium]HOE35260.1 peptidoglycan DD-metalloendopeptidase family protein [Anaerolineaceae bacterium]HQL27830.1 peptidoglycan DD-metalloendopeptidase family protein [Anaerolineaceae bacterium]
MSRSAIITILLLTLLTASAWQPPQPASPQVKAELWDAFTRRVEALRPGESLTFELFSPELDEAFLSPDGTSAVLWLALQDDAGRRLASEPGMVLAVLRGSEWQAVLPGDPEWEQILASLPVDLLPAEQRPGALSERSGLQAITGYYLPYAAGTARWLEGSIGHFQYIPWLGYPSCLEQYCRYAYDFTDDVHFPLVASKGGTVVASRDSCPDGGTTCTNFIVLRDLSTPTYQLYLHMAHGTIPDALTPGTAVQRGQYLGDTDDTGYSTSQHVHFMVTNSVWLVDDGYYWGASIDIRFADVLINNGIPRTCYEVTQFPIYDGAANCIGNKNDPLNPNNDWYTSGNVGAFPPNGTLTRPTDGQVVAGGINPLMDVTASVSDDVHVDAAQLLIYRDGSWNTLGPKVTQPLSPGMFDWDVNLCEAGGLNGSYQIGLSLWDHEGNHSAPLAVRTIQIDHACPPPASQLEPPQPEDSTALRLSWNAQAAGVPLGQFELQWRESLQAWPPGQSFAYPPETRETWFLGAFGESYDFRLRALDSNGQPEAWPSGELPEISVVMPAGCSPDALEPDDSPGQAYPLLPGGELAGGFCPAADQDWFALTLQAGNSYLIEAQSLGGGAAARLSLYAPDGNTLLLTARAQDFGRPVLLHLTAETAGVYFLRVQPLEDALAGNAARYLLRLNSAQVTHLPLLFR